MLILANVQINSGKNHDIMLQFYIFHKISNKKRIFSLYVRVNL